VDDRRERDRRLARDAAAPYARTNGGRVAGPPPANANTTAPLPRATEHAMDIDTDRAHTPPPVPAAAPRQPNAPPPKTQFMLPSAWKDRVGPERIQRLESLSLPTERDALERIVTNARRDFDWDAIAVGRIVATRMHERRKNARLNEHQAWFLDRGWTGGWIKKFTEPDETRTAPAPPPWAVRNAWRGWANVDDLHTFLRGIPFYREPGIIEPYPVTDEVWACILGRDYLRKIEPDVRPRTTFMPWATQFFVARSGFYAHALHAAGLSVAPTLRLSRFPATRDFVVDEFLRHLADCGVKPDVVERFIEPFSTQYIADGSTPQDFRRGDRRRPAAPH
jgi:hypothetical protein